MRLRFCKPGSGYDTGLALIICSAISFPLLGVAITLFVHQYAAPNGESFIFAWALLALMFLSVLGLFAFLSGFMQIEVQGRDAYQDFA